MNQFNQPAIVIEYTDPEEGFQGWLVIDSVDHGLCAGGMRVQKGLTREHLEKMAANMTCKMRICGLRVDGAKSGIDYDPAAPGKKAAMFRFMNAIEPYIRKRYSMGPDLNVDMDELESVGDMLNLPSVKMAVAQAQGWDFDYFKERYQILHKEIDGRPLGKIRAGYGVAAASLAVLDHLNVSHTEAMVVLQGFGTLAKATAYGLDKHAIRIMAIADQDKSYIAKTAEGLDLNAILMTEGTLLPDMEENDTIRIGTSGEIYSIPCDVFVPAAMENTITADVAPQMQTKAVVPGANLAVTNEADRLLYDRGIIVLPDLLAGSGGSLSMDGLFAPDDHPEPHEVLQHVKMRMEKLVGQLLSRSESEQIPPARAAQQMCSEAQSLPGSRPYGAPSN